MAGHDQDRDCSQEIQSQIEDAITSLSALDIRGSNSKSFYGCAPHGQPLELAAHCGIIHYAPEELVVTARVGTPMKEIEAILAEQNQMLAFEPPHYGDSATLGGTIATGLSGPRRAWSGAVRDFALGMTLINGRGERLKFGGEVMKNVAGYDVTRLQCGAMGTLGVILDASFKVLPVPESEMTLCLERDLPASLALMSEWRGRPLPISATAWHAGRLCLRLSGAASALAIVQQALGASQLEGGEQLWRDVKEQQLPFFHTTKTVWRISLPANCAHLVLPGIDDEQWVIEWGGALRWLVADVDALGLRRAVSEVGGHATCFRRAADSISSNVDDCFHPLETGIEQLHRRLKTAFDPHGILNPGRMYKGF